ncbi:MAG TPA: helix-turn-helix domain-containing protein [Methanoregulaceae archaeon]|nr:MAG: helix-turn-helix domain-containing protein [Methanolinea sp.]HON81576.1 helix-turn-helix domain-containing protein [Methanoregulaceae archaeon]HPD10383.1 helix-turn-helix domain-containing protein [Methanoregulaceae archaeon]HRT15325.1 helix-turn-helix domain-containing protein [Methanoregulaceae archaeon]HRU30975.1 helix-turn-helix domain-containing protein [Methanoregulaceae archaeon]
MKDAGCDIRVCDIMVRKYLPAMRAEMVLRLVQREGISQSDAAKRLGVSRAAISQYLSGKRGESRIELSGELSTLIDKWAHSVAGLDAGITVCDICRLTLKRD